MLAVMLAVSKRGCTVTASDAIAMDRGQQPHDVIRCKAIFDHVVVG
jgi:hypothetical protein